MQSLNEETGPLPIGSRFRGYVVENLLGAGGSGAVYLVYHEVLDARFALKVLRSESAGDETAVKRFLREARLASRIRHPNLVAVHDCGYDEVTNLYFLIVDYVVGSSLRQMLAFERRLDIARASDIVAQVSSALRAAVPYKVVHRDIKPENIMIQPDGLVKLVDLGVAKAMDMGESLSTNTCKVFGTPSYISPEQLQSSTNVDARADIYSLGIVFYEMLTGKCPYAAKTFEQAMEKILSDDSPPDVRDVVRGINQRVAILVRRMTTKDRDRRLGSFDAILSELRKMGLGQRVGAMSVAEVTPPAEKGMRTILEDVRHSSTEQSYDPLQDADESIRSFAESRRRRMLVRKCAYWGTVSISVAAIVFFTVAAFLARSGVRVFK